MSWIQNNEGEFLNLAKASRIFFKVLKCDGVTVGFKAYAWIEKDTYTIGCIGPTSNIENLIIMGLSNLFVGDDRWESEIDLVLDYLEGNGFLKSHDIDGPDYYILCEEDRKAAKKVHSDETRFKEVRMSDKD